MGIGWTVLAVLGCAGGGTERVSKPGTPADSDTGAPVDSSAPADSDTGTGPVDSDTDTGPLPDTSPPADTSACDPSPYVTHEGWDSGEPAAISYSEPVFGTAEDPRWHDSGAVDCDVSVTTAAGDPILDCVASTNFDMVPLVGDSSWTRPVLAEWLGDADADGYDDLLVRAIDEDYGDHVWVLYGGNPAVIDAGEDPDLDAVADAKAGPTGDARPFLPGGDFDGDGALDFLVGTEPGGGELGVVFGGGPRLAGDVTDWGTAAYWTDTWANDGSYYWDGSLPYATRTVRVPWGGDLDADGAAELVFADTHGQYEHAVVVIPGGKAFAPAGPLEDARAWGLTSNVLGYDRPPTDPGAEHVPLYNLMARPVGDLDGDGLAELAVSGRAWAFNYLDAPDDLQFVVPIGALPPCDYTLEDAAEARLYDDDWGGGGEFGPGTVQGMALPVPAGDLDGDGRDDLVLAGLVSTDIPVIWLLYGGEDGLVRGGSLAAAPDRIEGDTVPNSGGREAWIGDLAAMDLDGDGRSELVVGHGQSSSGLDDTQVTSLGIVLGRAGGVRGVQSWDEAFDPQLVVGPEGYQLTNALGHGDYDGDGTDDLVATWSRIGTAYNEYGDPVDEYTVVGTAMLFGGDLSAWLE